MGGGFLVTNTFRIPLLEQITLPYRLVHFEGVLLDDEEYDKNVQLLATTLGRQLAAPVALTSIGDETVLAVATLGGDLPARVNLCGAVAKLRPKSAERTLRFCGGDERAQDIAKKFLRWALRNSFYKDPRFWEHYGKMTEREPVKLDGYAGPINVYRTFGYGLVPSSSGGLDLSVDVSFCYVGRDSLQKMYTQEELHRLTFERCLYKYGLEWYLAQVSGPPHRLSEIEIPHPGNGKSIGLLPFIRARWAKEKIPDIESLGEDDLALHYKNNNNQQRWAAAPLLHQVYSPEDAEGAGIHHRSILLPHVRRREIEHAIGAVFSGRKVFGQPLLIEPSMHRLYYSKVPLPRLVFGNETELALHPNTLKTSKWEALRAPGVGPYTRTAFDKQYAVIPASMPPSMAADFIDRVKKQTADLYPESYEPELVVYDDSPRSLAGQLRAIAGAVGHRRGYLLQVLPRYAHAKLYTFLKRKQAELHVQSQCARLEKITSFYRETGPGKWEVKTSHQGEYRSHIKYLTLGLLAVNRKWLWRLADGTLHSPGYIGIDVYKGTAAFTFIYQDGRDIYFQIARSGKEERLSREMIVHLLLDRLPKDFSRLGLCPRSLVIHRDGRLCTPEQRALKEVAARLKASGVVPEDFEFIVVEVHKSSAYHPRLFWEQEGKTFNPRMGSFRLIIERCINI
jgi:hypothetical protein